MDEAVPEITYTTMLGEMFRCGKQNLGVLVQASLVFAIPGAILGFFSMLYFRDLETLGTGSYLVTGPIGVVFQGLTLGAVTLIVAGALDGQEVGAGTAARKALQRVVSIVIAVFVASIAIYISMMACFVPVLFVAPGLALTVPVLMVRPVGPLGAIEGSWRMTRGHRRAILSAFVAVVLISGTLNIGATVLFFFQGGVEAYFVSNPYRNLSMVSLVGVSVAYLFAALVGSILIGTLATVFYVRIAEQAAVPVQAAEMVDELPPPSGGGGAAA